MKTRLVSFVLIGVALSASFPVYAQNFAEIEIEERLAQELKLFSDDLNKLQMANDEVNDISDIERLEQEIKLFDLDFETFLQVDEQKLKTSKNLIVKLLGLKAAREDLSKSLEKKRENVTNLEMFTKAESFISAQNAEYADMYKKARTYSMSSKTGKLLAKLKSREAILNAKLEQNYSDAFAAAESIPELKDRFDILDDEYAELMSMSEKIQAAQYKPFIQRIQDYLMSFAAISVILMFISMLQMRISTAKQVRENLKKKEEALRKQDDNVPTI